MKQLMDKEFITLDTVSLATEAYKKVRACTRIPCAWHVHGSAFATEAYTKVDI